MNDRIALRAVLVLVACLGLMLSRNACAAEPGIVPGDYCDTRGDARDPWSREAKQRTQERIDAGLDDLEVSGQVRAFHHLVICREAFCGEASVRHTRGEDSAGPEDGLGPYGLSLRWHRDKWGPDVDPAFCTPEVSLAVAHEIMWRAVTRFGARNLVEVQAVYAGAFVCSEGQCRLTLSAWRRRAFCDRLRGYGHDCTAPITVRDLGRRLSASERRPWALRLARRWLAGLLGRSRRTESTGQARTQVRA